MSKLKLLIASLLLKRHWNVRVKRFNETFVVEVTDPSFLMVKIEDLFYEVIENTFRSYPYISISQFVDRDQWDFGKPEEFIDDISNNFSFPIRLTKGIDSLEEANGSERSYAVHVLYPPEKIWLRKVVRFSMTSNPNIIYGLQSVSKSWPLNIIQSNISFRKWFKLEAGDSQLESVSKEVSLFGWTEDGHFNIGINNTQDFDAVLLIITRLAQERSLIPIIEQKRWNRST